MNEIILQNIGLVKDIVFEILRYTDFAGVKINTVKREKYIVKCLVPCYSTLHIGYSYEINRYKMDISIMIIRRHGIPANCMILGPTLECGLISGGYSGGIYVQDTRFNQYEIHQQFASNHHGVSSLLLLPNSNLVSAGNSDTVIKVWKYNKNKNKYDENPIHINMICKKERGMFNRPTINITKLVLLNSELFASSDWRGKIRIFKTDTYELIQTIDTYYKEDYNKAIFSLLPFSDDIFISGGKNTDISVWKREKSCYTYTLYQKIENAHNSSILSLTKLNERVFASGSCDGKIKVWKVCLDNFKCVKEVKTESGYLHNIVTLKNGNIAISTYNHSKNSGEISIWR